MKLQERVKTGGPRWEVLEPRLLLAADVVISEIMYQSFTDLGQPEDTGEEFIELYNRGDAPASLLGWQLTDGVEFELPDVTLDAGAYLVLTANPNVFHTDYPTVSNYVSSHGWSGRLSNSGERIELRDADGELMDAVEYADEGDWSFREKVVDGYGMEGFVWSNLHDGGGMSLELINPVMTNNAGQNWAASLMPGGTPGAPNSVASSDIAPLIRNVEHSPAIPRSMDPVTIRAEIDNESNEGLTVRLYYREDGDPDFAMLAMHDDGLHDDAWVSDGVYAVTLPSGSFTHGTIVEFYVEAIDAGANARTWPLAVEAINDPAEPRGANCLFQVDDTFDPSAAWVPGSPPEFRAIMTAREWSYLSALEDNSATSRSNAQMNVTFIGTDGVGTQVRYEVGIRHRGNGSRSHHPHNQRLNISHDRPWRGCTAFALNTQRTHSQIIASAVFRYAAIPAADATAVKFLINGTDHADTGSDMYGHYVALEALDSDMAANHWPDDDAGDLYKCNDSNGPAAADLDYDGENPDNYNIAYVKQTNVAADDYSGLIHMLYVFNEAPEGTYLEDVAQVIDIEQWVRFLAVDTLLANGEGGLTDGRGDDYAMYQGVKDPRFTLVPYDLDTVLGTGSQSQTDDDIWDYRDPSLHGLERLLSQPEVAQMYYAQLLELCETVFSPETLNPLIDQALAWAPVAIRENIKTFAAQRVAYVRGQVANDPLSVQCSLPISGGYPRTTDSTVGLSGKASGAYARSILVNGRSAEWNPEDGDWWFDDGAGDYEVQTLVASDAAVVYHVPTDGEDPLTWTEPNFDDSTWVNSITQDTAGVLITEISTGATRFVEIENVSDHAINTTGWSVLVNDASGGINAINSVAWSLPASIAADEVLYQSDDAGDHYWGATIAWDALGPGWAMIVDNAGQVRDFLAWGYTAADIASLDIAYGGVAHITIGEEWSGDGAPVGTADTEMPTADILDVAPDPRNAAVDQIEIVFSKPVSGFDLSDLSLTRDGGANLLTAEALSSTDDTTWTLHGLAGLTGASGTYALTLTAAGSGIQDATGNPLAGDALDTWLTDTDPPTVDITDVAPDPHSAAVSQIAIVFSEAVRGLDRSDLRLTRDGGDKLLTASQTVSTSDNVVWTLEGLSGLTSVEGTYTLTLTATGSGIEDVAGNPLTVAASDTWETVGVAPTADIVDVTPDPRSSLVDKIEIVFSEPVSGLGIGDLSLSLDGGVNLLTTEPLSSSDNITWTLGDLGGLTAEDGTYTLTLTAAGSAIRDAAGNLLAGDASDVWVMDTQRLGWVAFNDHAAGPGTHGNATTYAGNGTSSGELRDIDTGLGTGAALTITASAIVYDNNGANPPSGSDAYGFFDGFVDFSAATGTSIEVEGSLGAFYTHTFSGLDTGDAATYDFVGTAIRGSNTYTNRWTLIALVGADAFTPAHSTGDGVVTSAFNPALADNQVAIWAGDNGSPGQGWVAHWSDIDPGPDGEFAIVSEQYTGPIPTSVDADGVADGTKTYGVVGVRLEEVPANAAPSTTPSATPTPASAEDESFVAYNDHVPDYGGGTHANTTDYSAMSGEAHSGLMKDIDSGADTPVTLEVTASGIHYAGAQENPAPGTDAYEVFDGFVDLSDATGASIELTAGDHYTYTFSDLDVGDAVTYRFAGTAVRGNSGYTDRWTLVTLVGADASTSTHSVGNGVVVISPTQMALWTGANHLSNQGFIAAWTDIDPGPDGEFSVVSEQYTGPTPGVGSGDSSGGDKGYGLTGIRLEQVAPSGPLSWLKRKGNTDGDGADDWARDTDGSRGGENTEMTVPFGTTVPNVQAVGFAGGDPAYHSAIHTDVADEMQGVNASLWTRMEFTPPALPGYDAMTLRIKYDDGFVAYLNGTKIAEQNAPATPAWNSAATAENPNAQAATFQDIDVSQYLGLLLANQTNVLAIHALNVSASDADLLLQAELNTSRGTPTEGLGLLPGVNRVRVEAYSGPFGTGELLDSTYVDVWYDDGRVTTYGGQTGTRQEISGTLTENTTLRAAGSWLVTGDVTVPAGVTLTVEPGAEVLFNSGVGVTVQGTLDARGTAGRRIRFASAEGQGAWRGFDFAQTSTASEIAYADIDNSDAATASVSATDAAVHLDHVTWTNHDAPYLDFHDSPIRLTYCELPSISSGELVHYWGLPADGYALIQGNVFGSTTGYNDIIDFTGGQRPGPILQFLDNVLLGGSDDGLDVDACDAHVEGNVFMHFHQDAPRESLSHAVSTGTEYGEYSNVTVVRNLFYDVDHALLVKDGGYGTFVNNTVVDATLGAINLYEVRSGQWEGAGVWSSGNIFHDVAHVFVNPDWAGHPVVLEVRDSILPNIPGDEVHWTGEGILYDADPLLVDDAPVDPTPGDLWAAFALRGGSPALETGPNGRDMGGVIPAGAFIAGEPDPVTTLTTATLTVGGPEIWGYKYRVQHDDGSTVDPGTWSAEVLRNPTYPGDPAPALAPIELSGLAEGTYTVFVLAKNSAAAWQDESEAVASASWTVGPGPAPSGSSASDVVALPASAAATASVRLVTRDSYLPGTPMLVRVEALDAAGEINRDLWDATATLSADGGMTLDVTEVRLLNGLGSVLVTPTGAGAFNLTATVNGMSDADDLADLTGVAWTEVSGTLTEWNWSGIVHVTADVLVPDGQTLVIDPGTLVLIDGVASGSDGVDIDVQGAVQSLGTEDRPVTFTATDASAAWGEVHHDDAEPSLYQYTNIHVAGNSPGGGHTGSGPAVRPTSSTITFDHTNITDNAGKVMQSGSGSDLTFRNCILARSVMGPEIDNTALLFEDSWITENHGPDDNDGIYIHSQSGGQDCTLRGGVIADMHDDGLDTLGATVLVEDYIFRDMADKGVSVFGGSVTLNGIISANNDIGISAKDDSHAEVHIDHATISGNTWGIQAENKGGGMDNGLIEYFVTNSVVYGNTEWAVRSDYPLDPIRFDYSIVGTNWISDGGYRGVADEVHTGEVWAGVDNQNADPLFVSPTSSDLHLQAGSPALLAGSDGSDLGYYTDGAQQPGEGELAGDTTWSPADGQFQVTGELTVPAGITLTIEPGTTVFFDAGGKLIVEGTLRADGTAEHPIRLTRSPGVSEWAGIDFAGTMTDNMIRHAIIEHVHDTDGMIGLVESRLTVENCVLDHAERRRITTVDSSLTVRNCTFTDLFDPVPQSVPNNVSEHIWGRGIAPGGVFLIEGNTFGTTPGHNDAIDFDGPYRPDPVAQIRNNVFLGGGDDALDLETDAHIEGNVFLHYVKDAYNPDPGESNVISAGGGSPGGGHHFVVVGNVFHDCEHAVLAKESTFLTFVGNTVSDCSAAAIYFDLPGQTSGPGEGAVVQNSIFANTAVVYDLVGSSATITIDNSLVSPGDVGLGAGNIVGDARLADPAHADFALASGSAAIGTGAFGLDMGAMVPAGAGIATDLPLLTYRTDATFTIGGNAVEAYRWRLDGGAWSVEQAPGSQVVLTELADGEHVLEVISLDSAGVWQAEADATSSSWTVDTALSRVLLHEVLASNVSYGHEGTFPDMIELYNDSPTPVDIGGMSISDDPGDPTKFVFPPDTTIDGESYLVLYADDATTPTSGVHLGFALGARGDDVWLFDSGENPVDSIAFGVQIDDLSLGRVGAGREWALTQPTPGTGNVPQPTADPDGVIVNEWFTNGDVVLLDDFIELYNPDTLPVDLHGLYLTDNPAHQKTKFQFGPYNFVAAQGFQDILADDSPSPGHVPFQLSAKMEILALYDAGLGVQDYVYYGPQTEDVSQGRASDGGANVRFYTLPTPGVGNIGSATGDTVTQTLAPESAPKHVLVPTEDIGTAWRTDLGYDTTGWHEWDGTPNGVGYDSGAGNYDPFIGLDVEAEMDDTRGTCYIRIPFAFSGNRADVVGMWLNIRYDDGFLVYLNGVEMHRENFGATDVPAWDSIADDGHSDSEAEQLAAFDLTAWIGELNVGDNLLAIHGLNDGVSSSDFLISAELVVEVAQSSETPFANLLGLHNDLRITEIMYNPAGSDDTEFLELQNTGTRELNLAGVRFADGINFVFPAWTLGPGEYVVVARDLPAFQAWYGTEVPAIGGYDPMALSNAGENILLQMPAPYDAAILRFEYDGDWYPSTDGDGASLVVNDATGKRTWWDERTAWHASGTEGGSPGAADPIPQWPLGAVVINEVLAHSDDPGRGDWIELYNTTETDIDISGWFLSDDAAVPEKYVIPGDPGTPMAPGNTILPAGGYAAFNQLSHFGVGSSDPGALIGFGLSELGDQVLLSSCDATGALGAYRDAVVFGATANSVSLGRYTTSTGSVHFVPMAEPTPDPEPDRPGTYGYANAGPLAGPLVFEEVMYHPVEGGTEYLLLRNASGAALPLFDTLYPENTWRISGGVSFEFPQTGVTVPADGLVLVVSTTPEDYLATHVVPAGVQVFGPLVGALSNGGETVTLSRPGKPELLPDPPGTVLVPYLEVESVKYNDSLPWPESPDGEGPALRRLDTAAYGNDPANWGASGAPAVTMTPVVATAPSPALTGTVTDESDLLRVIVTVNGEDYEADVTDNTWALAADTIGPLARGTYDVGVRAGDPGGNTAATVVIDGLTVLVPEVVGRHVFYNDSWFDGADPDANADDDLALATDKVALRRGQTATFANYTSYTAGLNGILIDVQDLPDGAAAAEHFAFRVGNSDDPSAWPALEAAPSIAVRPGAGVDGSDRITLTWPAGTIRNQWLEVRFVANAATHLAGDDVFYFGNAVGEAGDDPSNAWVTAEDEVLARNNPTRFFSPAAIDSRWDYNRDHKVNGFDQAIARNNPARDQSALRLIEVPGPAPAATGAAASSPDLPDVLAAGEPAPALKSSAAPLPAAVVAVDPEGVAPLELTTTHDVTTVDVLATDAQAARPAELTADVLDILAGSLPLNGE